MLMTRSASMQVMCSMQTLLVMWGHPQGRCVVWGPLPASPCENTRGPFSVPDTVYTRGPELMPGFVDDVMITKSLLLEKSTTVVLGIISSRYCSTFTEVNYSFGECHHFYY